MTAVIEKGLLRAVGTQMAIGKLGELGEGSEKSNGRDVRAGLRRREKPNVFGHEGCIVALAEEISIADGHVGEGERRRERRAEKHREPKAGR